MKRYDLIGIGVGPYHLGMAALIEEKEAFDALFFDQETHFEWHPGMLIDGTDLQVPFLADLVTFANPASRYTYLNYLHEHNRLFKFFAFNEFEIPRKEYNHYAQWVAKNLSNCRFGTRVTDVIPMLDEKSPYYEVVTENTSGEEARYQANHISIGTGSKPVLPSFLKDELRHNIIHSSQYKQHKKQLRDGQKILVIGSGQSAAEIFLDLLESQVHHNYELQWHTRSTGFLQLESSKFGQEFFTPDFVDFFHGLSFDDRQHALETLDYVRNGVAPDTLNAIYKWLYHRSIGEENVPVNIHANAALSHIQEDQGSYIATFKHTLKEESYTESTDSIILATGYKPNIPAWFYDRFDSLIEWEDDNKPKVSRRYQVEFKNKQENHLFLITNIEHSHGAEATNLGMAVNRNVHIINTIAGKKIYREPDNVTFQTFN